MDGFWPLFQLSPLEDLVKAKKCVHYFPLPFDAFIIFLRNTAKIDKETVDYAKYPIFSSIFNIVTSEDFQSLFPERDLSSLFASIEDEISEKFLFYLIEEGKTTFEVYAEWWVTANYLYPFCYSSDFTIEDKKFASGRNADCFRVKQFEAPTESFSIKLPSKSVFKSVHKFEFLFLDKDKNYEIFDLIELKLSLFFGLNECPYIHLLSH